MVVGVRRRAGRAAGMLCVLAVSVGVTPARAGSEAALRAPVASRNLDPRYASLGIPPAQDARGLAAGEWSLRWSLHWASHSLQERAGPATLEFDGETQRQDLAFTAGIGRGITLTLNLPWVRHSGGALDALIDDWHALWGMPDGPRTRQPRDRLRFALAGAPGFLLEDSGSGAGDLELQAAAEVLQRQRWSLALFLHGKFDTGKADDFTGSDHRAVSAGARFSSGHCLWAALSCHAQLGVGAVATPPWGAAREERVIFASASLAWAMRPDLALVAQLDAHESPYADSPLDANGAPLWATLGLRWAPGEDWAVDLHFAEDIAVGSAPDITFFLSLSRRF